MGRRGPAPRPTVLKVLAGNPDKQKKNRNEPKPRPLKPWCPSWLDDDAKREWFRVLPILFKAGLVTEADGTALAAYCQSYSMWKQATKTLQEGGFTNRAPGGYRMLRPEVAMVQRSLALIKQYCAEFGMTPSARSRMEVKPLEQMDETMGGVLS